MRSWTSDRRRGADVASVVTAPTLTVPDSLTSVVAHQGGWDEILMVVGPLAFIGLLLWRANRRVNAQLEQAAAEVDGDQDLDGAQTKDGDGAG